MWPFTKKEVKPKRDYLGEAMDLQLELAKIKTEADEAWDNVDKTDPAATTRVLDKLQALTSKARGIHLQMLTLVVDQQAER